MGKVTLKTVCFECGFKHRENTVAGVFIPKEYNNGRYDEPDTPRDYLSDDEDNNNNNNNAPAFADAEDDDNGGQEEGGLGNMFGNALAAPKTAAQKMQEARAAAVVAKKAAEVKAAGLGTKENNEEDLYSKLHRKMNKKELSNLRKERRRLGKNCEKLNTPRFVRNMGYIRCNCIRGVPSDEPKEYVAVPEIRYAEGICIRQAYVKEVQWKKLMPPSYEVLVLVDRFLDARSLAFCAMVSTEWRDISNEQPHYLDLKYMEVMANFEAHNGKIEDLFVYRDRIYTAGTKVVKVWGLTFDFNAVQQYDEDGLEKYSLLHTPVRDTAIITKIVKCNQSMYSTASNGAIREWILAHNIQNIKFTGAMWEHSAWINHFIPSLPTPGTCSMHGVVNHVCLLYSSSDDRQVFVWDSVTRKRLGKIEPPNKTCGTMRGMALSERHLFVGSSNGIIYVYPYEKTCERPDRHECSLQTGPTRFCLQHQLRHGEKPITALIASGRNHTIEKLFSGSQDGTIAIFQLEPYGYFFECVNIFDQHTAAITSLSCSWSHLYSGSDDETIRVWCLTTFSIQRVLNCGSRIKCLYLDEAKAPTEEELAAQIGGEEKEAPCGYLYCGLTNGFVQKWRIGQWM